MSTYFQHLSRATLHAAAERWHQGRTGGAGLSCDWSGGAQAAWVTVHGSLDDTNAHVVAEALRAVGSSEVRVVDLGGVTLGQGGTALVRAVLQSPRLVLKDPPDGLLEMMAPDAERCAVG